VDRQERTIRILEGALRSFARYGFKKTTLEDIAGELGMTKGNLYLYVKDKRDLYERSVARAFREWQERVAQDMGSKKDVVVRFRVMCVKAYQYLAENEDLRLIILRDPTIFTLSQREGPFHSVNVAALEMIKRVLEQGIGEKRFRQVDVESMAEFLFSTYVMFIMRGYVKSEGRPVEAIFEAAVDLMINGLLFREGVSKPAESPRFSISGAASPERR
jgi:AcrR family transcriptional regulator